MSENARLPRNIQGSFTCRKSTTWDKRLYFPSEGRRAEDFFALKNPTASVGFEPANLGTKGQHATFRPPKPLIVVFVKLVCGKRSEKPCETNLCSFKVKLLHKWRLPLSFPYLNVELQTKVRMHPEGREMADAIKVFYAVPQS